MSFPIEPESPGVQRPELFPASGTSLQMSPKIQLSSQKSTSAVGFDPPPPPHKERRGSLSFFDAIWKRGSSGSTKTRRSRKLSTSHNAKGDTELQGSDSDVSETSLPPSGVTRLDNQQLQSDGRKISSTWKSNGSRSALSKTDSSNDVFENRLRSDDREKTGSRLQTTAMPAVNTRTIGHENSDDNRLKSSVDKKSGWPQRMKKRIQHGFHLSNNNNEGEAIADNDERRQHKQLQGQTSVTARAGRVRHNSHVEDPMINKGDDSGSDAGSTTNRRRNTLRDGVRKLRIPFLSKDRARSRSPAGVHVTQSVLTGNKAINATLDASTASSDVAADNSDVCFGSPRGENFRHRAMSDTSTLEAFRRRNSNNAFETICRDDDSVFQTVSGSDNVAEGDLQHASSVLRMRGVSIADRTSSPTTMTSGDLKPRVRWNVEDDTAAVPGSGFRKGIDDGYRQHLYVTQRTLSMPNLTDDTPSMSRDRGILDALSVTPPPSPFKSGDKVDRRSELVSMTTAASKHRSAELTSSKPTAPTRKKAAARSQFSVQAGGGGGVPKESRIRRATSVIEQQVFNTAMFGRKSQGDAKKSAAKILDTKKDTVTRLKHLRILLENGETQETKIFFEQYYSYIYYLFHDGFTNVEASLGQRPSRAHREELDFMLFILENILILLPEMIHKRWQVHSIGRIMRKLLHTGNSLKLRREGLRLFILWYGILMENATDECHRMFCSLIPKIGLANTENSEVDLFSVRTYPNSRVTAPDIVPVLVPQAGDKQHDNPSKWMLEAMLHYMVSEVNRIEWNNCDLREFGFNFLFDKFKDYYLPEIFVDFKTTTSIYEPDLDLPEKRFDVADIVASAVSLCQETVVRWFANFTSDKSNVQQQQLSSSDALVDSSASVSASKSRQLSNNMSSAVDEPVGGQHETDISALAANQEDRGGSNASTLSNVKTSAEQDPNESSAVSGHEEHSVKEFEIVRKTLYSSRENVNCVHEVFRQAFLFKFHSGGALRRVVAVYKNWFQLQAEARPGFMRELASSASSLNAGGATLCNGDVTGRTKASHSGADVRAGMQRVIQVFITNSANVFVLEMVPSSNRDDASIQQRRLEDQSDLCKRLLNIYRYLAMNVQLEKDTWEQLLLVLLKITSVVLSTSPPPERDKSLGGRLAEHIFKALMLIWIKANLNIFVSDELWECFLKVLSSLTGWLELIREWAKTMDMLTRVLARHVYSLDLHDLPLDKMSELKSKRLRGARTGSLRSQERGHGRVLLKQISADNATSVPSSSNNSVDVGSTQQQKLAGQRSAFGPQRSRSGDSTPIGLSQNDIHHLNIPTAATEALGSAAVSNLVRSSSDSSLMVSIDKVASRSNSLTNCNGDLRVDCVSDSHTEPSEPYDTLTTFTDQSQFDDRLLPPPAPSITIDADDDCSVIPDANNGEVAVVELLANDSSSAASIDETALSFNMQTSNGTGSNGKFGSTSSTTDDKSDTDVLLRVSDSGSVSSRDSSLIQPQKLSPAFRPPTVEHLNGTAETEEVESHDDIDEVMRDVTIDDDEVMEKETTTGVDAVDEDMDDDDMEEEVDDTIQNLVDSQNVELEIGEQRVQIDDSNVLSRPADGGKVDGVACSVIAGGSVTGWTPEVAVVLWQRMLGSLGNVNEIRDPLMHEHVYEYLCDLTDTLIKLRQNLGVATDSSTPPTLPACVPPTLFITPWLYEALELSGQYKHGKLLAYQLLCKVTLRQQDIELSNEHLLRFYLSLHRGLVNSDQETINVIVRHCKFRFFALPLWGSTLMMLDLIHGASAVLSVSPSVKDSPRAEAMSLLGSLICLVSLYDEIPVLQPNNQKEMTTVQRSDVKDHVVGLLIKFGKCEPFGSARLLYELILSSSRSQFVMDLKRQQPHCRHQPLQREPLRNLDSIKCIALSCFGIFLHAELTNGTLHPKLKECVCVLLDALQLTDPTASVVSTHVLSLLAEHADLLLTKAPELPVKIVEDLANVVAMLNEALLNEKYSQQRTKLSSQVLVSVMFCLLEWCMRMPLAVLLDGSASVSGVQQKPLLQRVFDVLTMVIVGSSRSRSSQQTKPAAYESSKLLSDFNENELGHLQSSIPSQETAVQMRNARTARPTARGADDRGTESRDSGADAGSIKRAALAVAMHLLNCLYHFPLDPGAAQFSSSVHEYCDLYDDVADGEKLACTLSANNIQFFVLNDVTLFTFIEIPISNLEDMCSATAGQTTTNKICRVIIRDPSGKFAWDSAILYGPPNCRSASFLRETQPVLRIVEEIDESPVMKQAAISGMTSVNSTRQDPLDATLRHIELTSPECVLCPGQHLNAPARAQVLMQTETEETVKGEIALQQADECLYTAAHNADASVMAAEMKPTEVCGDNSIFHLCRLFLDQLGYMAWEKRQRFDLLKKSESLLRDLKNLDAQRCRDTHKIAVIYVADGQEDKASILGNKRGSPMFEQFVASLGWPVDLETHAGFMGGLPRSQTKGITTPYYASSTQEVVLHVSTWMPSDTEEDQLKKLRHLGNDEVHIVWSEHSREYRRGIIQTEFADVLIVIYPIYSSLLFRIHIICQSEVPFFGPLFDGAIVDFKSLPGLVRATAVNAGSMIRTLKPIYLPFYEERFRCVESLVQRHKLRTTYETFASQVLIPAVLKVGMPSVPLNSSNENVQPSQARKPAKANSARMTWRRRASDFVQRSSSLSGNRSSNSTPPAAGNEDNLFSRKLSLGRPRKSSSKIGAHSPNSGDASVK